MEAPVKLPPSLNDLLTRKQSGRIWTSQAQQWQKPLNLLCALREMGLALSYCSTTSGVSAIELKLSQTNINWRRNTLISSYVTIPF